MKKCRNCGANLDPQEICDCSKQNPKKDQITLDDIEKS